MDSEKKVSKFGIAWILFIVLIVLSIFSFVLLPLWLSSVLFVIVYLPILIFILIHKWIKKGFASFFFTFSIWLNILILIIPLIGGLVILDVSNFTKEFTNNPKYVVLQDNNLVFGISIPSGDISKIDINNLPILSQQDLNQMQTQINTKIIKDKTVFLVDKKVFRDIGTVSVKDLGIMQQKMKFLSYWNLIIL